MSGFLVQDRVKIKIRIRVWVMVRVGVMFNFSGYHWSGAIVAGANVHSSLSVYVCVL